MDPALQQLKDIHLPNAMTMWPIASGWIILFIIMLLCIALVSFIWFKRRQRKYTVKFALIRLKRLKDSLPNCFGNSKVAAEISTLMRRTALYYYRREAVAGLTGKAWINFLNSNSPTVLFTEKAGQLLTDAPYQQSYEIDLSPLFTATQAWLMAISKK